LTEDRSVTLQDIIRLSTSGPPPSWKGPGLETEHRSVEGPCQDLQKPDGHGHLSVSLGERQTPNMAAISAIS